MSEATALLRLQEIDLELSRLQKELDDLPERKRIAAAKMAARKVESEITKIVGARKDAEIELEDLEEERKRVEGYVAEASEEAQSADFKRVGDLELRLSNYAKQLEKNEFLTEQATENLIKFERAEKNARDMAAKLQTQTEELTHAMTSKVNDIVERARELRDERDGVMAQIPPEHQTLYIKTVERTGGVAVERLVGNKPTGCRVALQPAAYNDLKRGPEVTTCPYCKRILITTGINE
jgi:hypothetical protein